MTGDWKCVCDWSKVSDNAFEWNIRLCLHTANRQFWFHIGLGKVQQVCVFGKWSYLPEVIEIRSFQYFSAFIQALNGTTVGTDCSRPEPQPNVFLMSVVLFGGTYIISVILKDFKNSLFFPSMVCILSCSLNNIDWNSKLISYSFSPFLKRFVNWLVILQYSLPYRRCLYWTITWV